VSLMDLNYSYSLVSFLVGLLSGFQFVAEKYRRSIGTWERLTASWLRRSEKRSANFNRNTKLRFDPGPSLAPTMMSSTTS
jgi:hypothetical protein